MSVKLIWVTPDAESLITYIARVSNPKNQQKQLDSENPEEMISRLISFLIRNKHFSPFEMVNACFEIKTTRAISAQIIRHRSFCLGADSVIWFDLPDKKSSKKYKPYKKSISYLYDRFHNGALPLPNGVRQPMKQRIKKMRIRCLNEETGEIIHSHITDITKDKAHLYKVSLDNGNSIVSSKDHKYFTSLGWLTLEEALFKNAKFAVQGCKVQDKVVQAFPPIDESSECWLPVEGWPNYFISDYGRLKRVGKYSQNKIRIGSVSKSIGYPIVSLNTPGKQKEYPVHQLVLKAFKPQSDYTNLVCRHLNHNKLDNRLVNLEWGSDLENKLDTQKNGNHKKLQVNFVSGRITEDLGIQDSYDISVEGPWHNFICDGVVVHNSFQELSQRYAELNKTNFVYPEIRYKGATNRQSSLSYEEKGYAETKNKLITDIAHTAVDSAYSYYETLLDKGVAPESARMVLPMCSPTTIYMNGTLRSWIHYCAIRTEDHVQKEHRDIALSIENILKEHFPLTWKAINYELT